MYRNPPSDAGSTRHRYSSLDQNTFDVYKTKLGSFTESVKENVSEAYENAHTVGVQGYKDGLSSLADYAKQSASKAYEDARDAGVKWDEYKGRVSAVAESVQDAGTRRAQNLLRVYWDGSRRLTESGITSLKSMSMNRARKALKTACRAIGRSTETFILEHPYIIGCSLLGLGLGPLIDISFMASKLLFAMPRLGGIEARGATGNVAVEHQGCNGDGRSHGHIWSYFQSKDALGLGGPTTPTGVVMWPVRLYLGCWGIRVLMREWRRL